MCVHGARDPVDRVPIQLPRTCADTVQTAPEGFAMHAGIDGARPIMKHAEGNPNSDALYAMREWEIFLVSIADLIEHEWDG